MEILRKFFDLIGVNGTEPQQDGYDEGYGDQYEDVNGGYEQDGYDGYDNYAEQQYEEPQEPVRPRRRAAAPQQEQEDEGNVFAGRRGNPRDNVVPMNATERKPQKMRVENLMPEVSNEALMNEACENIINRVMSGEILVISTVNVDDKQRTRMVLMLSGASFAMGAHFSRVNAMTYIMAPKGVELSQESAKPRTPSFFEGSDFFGSK